MEKQPNILFIVIDALRAKNVSCYGYPRPTSPRIDSLAKEGVMFEKAFSCAVTTYPSLTSIFSGEYPLSHGILTQASRGLINRKATRLNTGTVFLPEILKSEGYVTLAVDWLGGWFKRGYDFYSGLGVASQRYKIYELIWKQIVRPIHRRFALNLANFFHQKKIQANTITEQAINLIRKVHDKKFFLFLHYWDTHIPYNPPKRYVNRFNKNDYGEDRSVEQMVRQLKPKQGMTMRKRLTVGIKTLNEAMARYDAAIAYVDDEIGRLIGTLEAEKILDKTLIVITSDHGESLTEHGIYFCHHGLYDVTTHVPLVFYYLDHFPGNRRISSLVQHVDITPTLLDILGVKHKFSDMDGKSAFQLIYDETERIREVAFIEEADTEHKRAIRSDKYKYIQAISKEHALCKECDKIHGGIEEFYDLNMDPKETNNTIREYPEKAEELKKELSEWVRLLNTKGSKKPPPKTKDYPTYYSEEEEKVVTERLKELGYF